MGKLEGFREIKVDELCESIHQRLEINTIADINELINNKILVFYVMNTVVEVEPGESTKISVRSGSKLQEHPDNIKLKSDFKKAMQALEFYADPKSWSKINDCYSHRNIVAESDCADYPHITRDVRITGGALARKIIAEVTK